MPINHELLEKLTCPNRGNDLIYNAEAQTLDCSVYDCTNPITKNVPIIY